MTTTYSSAKRNRVYKRKFDHDLCRELWADGSGDWTKAHLAELFGVSTSRISQVTNPHVAARAATHAVAYLRAHSHDCKDCGSPITRGATYNRERRGQNVDVCGWCDLRAANPGVRPDELLCSLCHLWLPDESFGAFKRNRTRRHRRTCCGPCEAARRRLYRQEHAGRPASPPRPHPELDAAILKVLQQWHAEHGAAPSRRAWHEARNEPGRAGAPSDATIVRRFGTWNHALDAAVLPSNPPTTNISNWNVARSIDAWARQHGSNPTMETWDATRRPGTASAAAIEGRYGGWNRALAAAGLNP